MAEPPAPALPTAAPTKSPCDLVQQGGTRRQLAVPPAQAELDAMQAKFDAAMSEKQRLQDEADTTKRKMDSATQLLTGLAGERASRGKHTRVRGEGVHPADGLPHISHREHHQEYSAAVCCSKGLRGPGPSERVSGSSISVDLVQQSGRVVALISNRPEVAF